MADTVLRLPAFCKKIGYGRTSVYDKLDPKSAQFDPTMPKPIRLGARAIGFLESEADLWISKRAQESRAQEAA